MPTTERTKSNRRIVAAAINAIKAVPTPVKTEGRNCFGIAWFATEAEAVRYAEATKGRTYNGGFFHGQPCGRDTSWDYTDDTHGPLYAVTN